MSSQYSQSRARGFAPLFRDPPSDQHLRVSDAERQAVTDRLAEHFGDGRLDHAEFDERIGRAMSARTRADLNGIFDDLPETGALAVQERPRRRRGHPVLVVVLIVFLIAATAHAVLPLLSVALVVAAVLFTVRAVGRSRVSHDRLSSCRSCRNAARGEWRL